MKLLISGATGFVGKHLVKNLREAGHEISIITRPTSKEKSPDGVKNFVFDGQIESLIKFLKANEFEGVIHLASLFLAQHTSGDIQVLINSNVLFSTLLLEAAVKSNVPWFINTGTFWQHYQNAEFSPVNLYAATKQAFEDIAKYYFETSEINFVTLKLSDTFGPNDTRPKIFNLWLKISKTQEALEMSPGEQIIDISYIDNVIDGYMRLVELLSQDKKKQLKGRSFAIKSAERTTLKELSIIFEEVTGRKLNINWGARPYRPREVMLPWEKGETIPGWKPKISLREGIKRTFNDA
ncbi:NAD(P)-dependent oxidoreductase [Candidatus Parcubacteria bacterium]|jgi:nucleoside-diphosphate-sugar epimerase|nr:MAG: NAD(P)-dependent oxidoreductase [Candidatus Parcubacteria bacterium]